MPLLCIDKPQIQTVKTLYQFSDTTNEQKSRLTSASLKSSVASNAMRL